MCRCFCIGFIDFILKGKTLTEYRNILSPNDFKKNDDIILSYLWLAFKTINIKMKSYCLKCWKDTENIDSKVSNSSNGRVMILSKCAICKSKKSRFIKNQEAKRLLSKLGIRTPLSKIPLLGDILF